MSCLHQEEHAVSPPEGEVMQKGFQQNDGKLYESLQYFCPTEKFNVM